MDAAYRQDPLWLKLDLMELDDPDAPVPLSRRISAETGLPQATIRAAFTEYKKFIFAAIKAGIHPEMPRLLDRIWSTHVTYTWHYWNHMCGEILGQELHYLPPLARPSESTEGEPDERNRQAYIVIFGAAPPTWIDQAVPSAARKDRYWFVRTIGGLIVISLCTLSKSPFPLAAAVGAFLIYPLLRWVLAHFNELMVHYKSQDFSPYREDPVWQAIQSMIVAPVEGAIDALAEQLAAETRWSHDFCSRAIAEYRRVSPISLSQTCCKAQGDAFPSHRRGVAPTHTA